MPLTILPLQIVIKTNKVQNIITQNKGISSTFPMVPYLKYKKYSKLNNHSNHGQVCEKSQNVHDIIHGKVSSDWRTIVKWNIKLYGANKWIFNMTIYYFAATKSE